MTYKEIQRRLSKCERTLELFKKKDLKVATADERQQAQKDIKLLNERITTYKALLLKEEKTYILTPKSGKPSAASLGDDEVDALKDADDIKSIKGADGEEVKERLDKNKGVEFSLDETKAIAKKVGKAVAKSLKAVGDSVTAMKAHRLESNSFDIHVEYKNGRDDEFSFYISDDTLHLVDFSFDKELVDVGVKPSGEAIVHVDHLANELQKHFKSLSEDVNEVTYNYYTTPKHFDICPGAEALRDKLIDGGKSPEELGEWTYRHDQLFKLEKDVLKSKYANIKHVNAAEKLRAEIIHLSRDLGIDADDVAYLKGHVQKIQDVRMDVSNEVVDDKDTEDLKQLSKDLKGSSQAHLDQKKKLDKLINTEGEGDDHHYIKVSRRDYKKAMSILNNAAEPSFVKMDVVDNDGAGNVIIYFMFNEFADDFDVEEREAFMYDAVMDLQSQGLDIADHSAELDEAQSHPVMVQQRIAHAKKAKQKERDKFAGSDPKAGSTIKGRGFDWKREEYKGKHQGTNYQWPMSQAMKDRKEADKEKDKSVDKTKKEALDHNDPVLMRARVAKMRANDMKKLDALKKSDKRNAPVKAIIAKLKAKRAEVEREMENDPGIEPEGGPVADKYGDMLNKIDNAIEKAATKLVKENQPTVFDDESFDALRDIILKYVKDPDDAEKLVQQVDDQGLDSLPSDLEAQLERDPEFEAWYHKLHYGSDADTDYTQRRRAEKDYMSESTDLYDRNGIQITRFSGGERGLMVQINYGGKYIHVPADEFATLARAMQSVIGDIRDMTLQMPRKNYPKSVREGRKDNDALFPDNPRLPEIKELADKIVSMVKAEAAKGELGYINTMEEIRYQQEDDFERTPEWNKAKGIRADFNEGVAKIQKAHGLVVAKMKELAKQYKGGDKSVVDQLKDLTAKKKALEISLDKAVADKGRGQQLAEISEYEVEDAIGELGDIIRAIDNKAEEAREIVRQVFPNELSRLDSYGAFNMTYSNNRYDVTLGKFVERLEEEGFEIDDDGDVNTLEGKYKSDAQRKAIYATKAEKEELKEGATCCGRCGRVHVKGSGCKRPYLKGKSHCRNK